MANKKTHNEPYMPPGDGGRHEISPKDAVKPFTIVKQFTFISLIVIFAGTIFLSIIITHRARAVLLEKSEEYALLLASNLNHQVFLQFIIPTALHYGRIKLSDKGQYEMLDKVVRGTLHGFNVDRVSIYTVDNIISYSFEANQVGQKGLGGLEYKQAMEGKSTSSLIQSGPIWAIFMGVPTESRLFTYTPLFAEKPMARISNRVLGVIEIRQNLSEDFHTIFNFQLLIIVASTGVMFLLIMVLRLYVLRGEEILWQRATERLRLEEQLSRAQRLASLGEMAAGVSHEIRNPLGIIRSTAQLLKKRSQGDEAAWSLEDVIIEESSRINDIITDFLNFARPQVPLFQTCRIEDILQKNLSYIAPRLTQEKCQVQTHYAENLPSIEADPNLLYQAFLNLFINAMQAMPDGGTIYVEVNTADNKVNVELTDEGLGLDESLAKRIWDPFFTTKDKGTGLGLCVVRNIMESHGGTVWIDNAPEKGARVHVSLPVSHNEENHGNHSHSG